ncbi:hypothetical protein [Paraferrimonas sp. SM1919]|uniref:hypothetical protein n=1 Tax=Paraferrimonas sp. SM1919 TaxID=2662263 RepID=UPI0013D3D57B|nr:hypothetical protein [Paraferrimonas sp. SM1919]
MSWIVILGILFAVLLLTLIIVNALQQYKEKMEAQRKIEKARQKAIIDETELILAQSGALVFPSQLIQLLYLRVHSALTQLYQLTNEEKLLLNKANIEQQINKLEAVPTDNKLANFKMADDEQTTIHQVQLLKKLHAIIRQEQLKGNLSPQDFSLCDNHITILQLKININSSIARIQTSILLKQLGSARQGLTNAQEKLAILAEKLPDSSFVANLQEQLNTLAPQLEAGIQPDKKYKVDDIDELFQPKRKW